MADRWADLFGDEPAITRKDMGPEARRAAAGRPPEAGTRDPNPNIEPQFGSVPNPTVGGGKIREPGQIGRLPQRPPANIDPTYGAAATIGPTGEPIAAGAENYRAGPARSATELEGDPIAQGILGSALTAPVAGPLLGAAARVGPLAGVAAIPAIGAAQGATIGGPMSGGGTEGAKTGAFLGALFSLPSALEGVGTVMSQKGRDLGIVQDLAPYAPAEARQQMRQIGYAKVAETARKYGVVGAKDPMVANESVKVARDAVGKEIGDVYGTLGNEYARPTTGFMANVEREAQSMRGTRAGNEIADAMFDEAKRIHDLHGDTGTMPLRDVRRELTDSQSKGYSGAKFEKLGDASKEKVQRALARHLQAELDAGLTLAGKDPRFASMVERVPELNATYRSLDVLDNTTGRMVDRAMTRRQPTIGERARAALPGNRLPASAQPVTMPTGKRVSTIGQPSTTPSDRMVAVLRPGLASALARKDKDPDAVAAEMARELFASTPSPFTGAKTP